MASSGGLEVLQQMASTPQRELLQQRSDGSRLLDLVFDKAKNAGLLSSNEAVSDIKGRLLALFDAALTAMPTWVVDYIETVCNDPNLMSNDPMEAVLLDGAFIVDWASQRVRSIEEALQNSLRSESAFQQYASIQLQQELSKINVLSAALHALWRIRGRAAAGGRLLAGASSAGGQQGGSGIQAELDEVLLVQQALQVASWCVRQGLHTASPTGRFASVQEWMRAVQARRDRRPTNQSLFLDDILRDLNMPGAYPFASLPGAIFSLGCVARDTTKWHSKLALLCYYLADMAGLCGDTGPLAAQGAQLLRDLAASFKLQAATVAVWHAAYLLDTCTVPYQQPASVDAGAAGSAEQDPAINSAVALLVANAQRDLPLKFIEVLVGLGRPDAALALHRAASSSSSSSSSSGDRAAPGAAAGVSGLGMANIAGQGTQPSIAQARILVELRLRCGLLAEALQLARSFISACPPARSPDGPQQAGGSSSREEMRRALLTAIAEWAVSASQQQSGGGHTGPHWASAALLEMLFTDEEEAVLASWLVEKLESPGPPPASFYLPLLAASRWRAPESLAAFKRWADVVGAGTSTAPGAAAAIPLIDAIINAQAPLLPLPMRNMALDGGQAMRGVKAMPPGLAGLTQGLVLTNDAATDTAQAKWAHRATGWVAPPFTTTRIGPAPTRPAAAETSAPDTAVHQAGASSAQQPQGPQQAGGTGFSTAFGGPGSQPGDRVPMQTSLFGQGNVGAAGGNAGTEGFTTGAAATSGTAAGKSLFSLGGDAAQSQQQAAAGPSRGMFGFQVGKKPRTEDWQA